MPNTIQVKRFETAGDTPTSRGATLSYGELCVNTADKKLWVGTNTGTNVMLSNAAVAATAPTTENGALWYDTAVSQLKIWDGSQWQITSGSQVTVINDLTDVDTATTAPVAGDLFSFDGSDWVPSTPSTPVTVINDLTDVDTVTVGPVTGDLIYFDGNNWVPTKKFTERRTLQTVQQGAPPGIPLAVDLTLSGMACLVYGINTSAAARVALYNDDIVRNADMGRVYPTPPTANTVLFEGTTLVGGTIDMVPPVPYVGVSASLIPIVGTFLPVIIESQVMGPPATLQVDVNVLVLEY